MEAKDTIPGEALVVRGGRYQPEDIRRRTAIHPSGVTGISVQCSRDVKLEVLAASIPHGQIGVTTVEKVRDAGGDVVRTSGRSEYHATLTGLSPEQAGALLTPTIANPAKTGSQE